MYVFICAERCSISFVWYQNWPLSKKKAEIIVWNWKRKLKIFVMGKIFLKDISFIYWRSSTYTQIARFMGPTWVLSAPDGPHVGPMNLAIQPNMQQLWAVFIMVILAVITGFMRFVTSHSSGFPNWNWDARMIASVSPQSLWHHHRETISISLLTLVGGFPLQSASDAELKCFLYR